MSLNDLCELYRETFGEETNARKKRWLVKRIAWKLQANAEGDISERARRLATEIALSTSMRPLGDLLSSAHLQVLSHDDDLLYVWGL